MSVFDSVNQRRVEIVRNWGGEQLKAVEKLPGIKSTSVGFNFQQKKAHPPNIQR